MFAPVPSLRSTRVVLGEEVRPATVHYEDGVIVEIGAGIAQHDYGDLVVLPGLVDSHVHVNEPGRTDWEGFGTATRAAAAGGTTTIVDMPLNSVPPTVDPEALGVKRATAIGQLSVDTAFWAGLVPGSEKHLDELVTEGVCGFKAFLVDSGVPEFPPVAVSDLEGLDPGVPLLVHAEAEDHLGPLQPPAGYADYLESRPPQAEAVAIQRLYGLRAPMHILHVSAAEGAEALAAAPGEMTGETCPHYLLFSAEEVPDGATEFKCAPPIREAGHREALWEALLGGVLDMVVSDHSPSPPQLKAGDFATAWGGISSLQLRLPATWTAAGDRGVGLPQLGEWLSAAPARLAGLDDAKGSIQAGRDADFVVWDPEGITTVRGADLEHRHSLTPYEGMTLRGVVVATVLGGETVYDGGRVKAGHGRMLRRR